MLSVQELKTKQKMKKVKNGRHNQQTSKGTQTDTKKQFKENTWSNSKGENVFGTQFCKEVRMGE